MILDKSIKFEDADVDNFLLSLHQEVDVEDLEAISFNLSNNELVRILLKVLLLLEKIELNTRI